MHVHRRRPVSRCARQLRAGLALLILLASAGFTSIEALFAPDADLWPRWQAHDPASAIAVDHAPWSGFLERNLVPGADGINRFAHAKVGADDQAALEAYVASLALIPVSRLDRRSQRAYWINLYNALTLKVILDHPGRQSIRDIDISPGFFADGPWGRPLLTIEGEAITLNDIEHRILRPIWRDPRLHYALNCAALGCPNLQPVAYTKGNTERLLEAGAKAYVNHPRGVSLEGDQLNVSSIYIWFQADFGSTDSAVIAHLKSHAEPALRLALEGQKEIDGHAYDWSLNTLQSRAER